VDLHAALDVATAGFARTLALVRHNQWESPTPNPGWDVRDLVNHVVGGNLRYVLLLAGGPTEEVEALRGLDHLADDPYAGFQATAAEVSTAFAEPGALDRVVRHRMGDRLGFELLVMRVTEHALHGWDLARAIGQDDAIDSVVVEALLAEIDGDPTSRAWAGFAPMLGADDLTGAARLLALTGRE
jgi:uncharacterized protein (TIGR03086 family)